MSTVAQRFGVWLDTPMDLANTLEQNMNTEITVIDPIAMFPEMKAFHNAQFVGTLKIGRRKSIRVLSIEDASYAYQTERDMSGEGGSTFPDGVLTIGARKYHISYNGKVWNSKTSWETESPVFNPYS